MGVREDGILLTDDVGGGGATNVAVISPIGQDTMTNSVSVAIASDQSSIPVTSISPSNIFSSGTIAAVSDFIDVNIPDGYNSVVFYISPLLGANLTLKIIYNSGGVVTTSEINPFCFDIENGKWIAGTGIIITVLAGQRALCIPTPGIDNSIVSLVCTARTAGSCFVTGVASISQPVQNNLTNQELRASDLNVNVTNASIPVTGTVTGNQGTPAVVGNAWPIKVTDGADIAEIRPVSSTPTYTADPALVITSRDMVANSSSSTGGVNSNRFLPIGGNELSSNAYGNLPLYGGAAVPALTARNAFSPVLVREQVTIIGSSVTLNNSYPNSGGFGALDGGLPYNGRTLILSIENTSNFKGTIRLRGAQANSSTSKTDIYAVIPSTGQWTLDLIAGQVYLIPSGGTFNTLEIYVTNYQSGTATAKLSAANSDSVFFGLVGFSPNAEVPLGNISSYSESYNDNVNKPLSLTNDGRLRVTNSPELETWQFSDPWGFVKLIADSNNPWSSI